MKSSLVWIFGSLFGLLLVLLIPGMWMLLRPWMAGSYGMMGGGYYPMHMFGWGGMLVGWLIPAGAVFLLLVGAVAVLNRIFRSGNTPSPVSSSRACPECATPIRDGWHFCPNCGRKTG